MRRTNTITGLGKQYTYEAGVLGAWHRGRNRRRLTVVMFHRVIPPEHPAWRYSEPSWLITDWMFRECLRFFARHYTVISLEDLLAISGGHEKAPQRPLLITFDDGWSDTAEYAAPLLKEYEMPALSFVVTDGIGKHELWNEAMIRAWRQKRLRAEEGRYLWNAAGGAGDTPVPSSWENINAVWALIGRLNLLEASRREELLRDIANAPGVPERPEMLTCAELRSLRLAGFSIGSHGVTHTPIPHAQDPVREFRSSRSALAGLLEDPSHPGLDAFSFPRGIYDDRAIATATQSGYRLLFTSDEHLNVIPDGTVSPTIVLGRINIPSTVISDDSGRFNPAALASWLFLRRRQASGRI
jgi:peptidoglycan/xylan/chitin deacetylase (PgdA/CDA1 family)